MLRFTRTITLVLLSLSLAIPGTAGAAFPGSNGPIAYARSYKHGLEIFSTNSRTGKSQRLTSRAILEGDTMAAGHPSFGPDGKRIVFTNAVQTEKIGGRRNDVYVMRADGSHVKRLTNTEAGESLPAFTADGKMVAYSLAGRTYLINANGTGERTELTAALPNGGIGATFSPDGTKVAVASSGGGDSDIFVMNADGTDPVNVTAASPNAEYSPDFSPDGTRLAFISNRNDVSGDLFTMAVDGGDVVSVAANDGIETAAPAYSPDGKQIAYETRENSKGAIGVFVIDADGGTPTQLPHAGAVSEEPSWGVR